MPKRKRAVPDPPPELIHLLQSSPLVLDYFTALQENLLQDTATWKERSRKYQTKCIELEKQLKLQQQQKAPKTRPTKKPPAVRRKKEPTRKEKSRTVDDNDDDDRNEETLKPAAKSVEKPPSIPVPAPAVQEDEQPTIGQEIDDDMLNDMFDSDDSDEKHEDETDETAVVQEPQSRVKQIQQRRLQEVNEHLHSTLGVASSDNTILDLLHVIKCIAKCKQLAPFLQEDDYRPSCNTATQVTYQAKTIVFQALCNFELYAANVDEQYSAIGNDVEGFMKSLHGEIHRQWPVMDRSTRFVSKALHFEEWNQSGVENTENKASQSAKQRPSPHWYGQKSHLRLATLLERTMWVQMLVHYYDAKQESYQRLHLLLQYLLSTAPAPSVEDYPLHVPVLEMPLIEAMLVQQSELTIESSVQDANTTCVSPIFVHIIESEVTALSNAAQVIHFAAQVWKKRLSSTDDRITDMSRVHWAAYERIIKLSLSWIGKPLSSMADDELSERIESLTLKTHEDVVGGGFLMLLKPNLKAQSLLVGERCDNSSSSAPSPHLTSCIVYSHLQTRQLDEYRNNVGKSAFATTSLVEEQEEYLSSLLTSLSIMASSTAVSTQLVRSISAAAKCCLHLSSAMHAARLFEMCRPLLSKADILDDLMQLSQIPVIRYINMRRRVDRSNAFQAQAKAEQLLIVKAVVEWEGSNDSQSHYWGEDAHNGRDVVSWDKTKQEELLKYVSPQWRPSDLAAFDTNAQKDNAFMSDSERACAWSHVSSWEGVRRSLEVPDTAGIDNHLSRLFRISGHARGKAVMYSNADMSPTPVCVIMEDDAILVDRFSDRLNEVLEELPRDFHFCYLGYSRPKVAPIVPYSPHVGIPTCMWYMTGYILSLEGARYLLESTPVRGPVDAWMGLKTCNTNWDNQWGQKVGVGMMAACDLKPIPNSELQAIFKFRAFCSTDPLCSQRVAASAVGGRGVNRWRQDRDTDIVYSGA